MSEVQIDSWLFVVGAVLAVIGAIFVLKWLLALAFTCRRHLCPCKPNLLRRYGKDDSWALVTGGSDGIGLALCHQLAEEGFNICIVSRSEAKINEKLAEITAKHPQIKTRAVVFDFAEKCRLEDYREILGNAVKDIDVALVFLNAGFAQVGAFTAISDSDIHRQVSINALQPIYAAKALVDQLCQRNHQSALVITTSGLAYGPFPGALTYACTETFACFLAQGLAYELKSKKIDCLSWQRGPVNTKMMGEKKAPPAVEPPVAVAGMLSQMGSRDTMTWGCKKHAFIQSMTVVFPWFLLQKVLFTGMQKMHKQQQAEGRAEATTVKEPKE